MQSFLLPHFAVFDAWREQARACIAAGLHPDTVTWQRPDTGNSLFGNASLQLTESKTARRPGAKLTVPRSFLDLAEVACCHSSENVFDQLYRLLLRVTRSPSVMENPADPDVARILAMTKSVSRDTHKMKAFVRFKDVGQSDTGRRQFVSWFEPEHYIVDNIAGFFARRFADMDWVIDTSKGSVSFVNNTISFRPFVARPPERRDDMDDLWRTYYASIFNPARLKLNAMTAEMPRKYWKNLPEASIIPALAKAAGQRALAMQRAAPSTAPATLARFKAPTVLAKPVADQPGTLVDLHAAARSCQKCDLCKHATQTVCGEGPAGAALMFVGEQPGDEEDLAGRPFVGPAGQILDRALATAGMDRSTVYVTNAVKHFKFTPRGKRRLHQRPNSSEIDHCRWWLARELAILRPRLVVAMGATALQALTGDRTAVAQRRGHLASFAEGTKLLATYHPSAILRHPEPHFTDRIKDDFFADIARAKQFALDGGE